MLLKKLGSSKRRLTYKILVGRLEVSPTVATNSFQVSIRRGRYAIAGT
jgi:hypothetical protein